MLQAISTFAQDYTYYTYTTPTTDSSGFIAGYTIFSLLLAIPAIAGLWRIFQKAGKPGWAAIIPIYNIVVYLQVVGRPLWWIAFFLLMLIPFVNIIVAIVIGIILANDMAKSFGKDAAYTVLLFLLPFVGYPILGFGKAEYKGPAALGATGADTTTTKTTHPTQHHE